MSDSAVGADHVAFAYEPARPVLHGITVQIARGGLVGILGPNGSGKTTLLRLLGGLLRPTAGHISLNGTDLRALSPSAIARRIAVVPQETHLAFDYTVLEFAMMGRYPHLGAFAVEGPEDFAIARDALRATGTLELETRLFNTLSGGEKQRVVIASALAQRPEMLLLDEPTASLDLAYQLEIQSILRALNSERGITIVVSTHDLNFAAGLCRQLILLGRGHVLSEGGTASMLHPELIRRLYGVEVDISTNVRTGNLTVVPVGRTGLSS